MISLNKTVVKKYAYVKDGIIFNIKSINNGDACAKPITEDTVPFITTAKTSSDTPVKLYFDGYIEDGVMMQSVTDKGTYCLAPTAEEAITTFVENRVTSHKQLPVVFYQIGPKFRNEIRNRGYLLRGKEFLMFDLYSFDKDEESMMETYKKIKGWYRAKTHALCTILFLFFISVGKLFFILYKQNKGEIIYESIKNGNEKCKVK